MEQIQTFKHIKKDPELFLGLNFWTILKVILLTLFLIYIGLSFKLALNSPLFIFLSIIYMCTLVILIKASQEPEIKGYYSSYLFHPFQNQHFTFNQNLQGYSSIQELIDIDSINDKYLITKDQDLIAILELNEGIIINKLDQDQIHNLLKNWENILTIFSEIKNIKSYFFAEKNYGDIIEVFIDIQPYKKPKIEFNLSQNYNYNFYQNAYTSWFTEVFNNQEFIPDPKFYIVIRQKNHRNNVNPIIKKIKAILTKKDESYYNNSQKEIQEDSYLLEEKIKTLIKFFNEQDLQLKQLENSELKVFFHKWFSINFFDQEIINNNFCIIDKAKYLEHYSEEEEQNKKYISKTYRLSSAPESGDLNFWLLELIRRARYRSQIAVHLITRNPLKDRFDFEQKSLNTRQLNSGHKQSSAIIIKEAEEATAKLLEKNISFDLSIFITVFAETEEELQKIDNHILCPIKYSKIRGLERQQINNYIYSLPFAYNQLDDKERLFASIQFAKSCFSFISDQIGTKTGSLIGFSRDNHKAIFLDDYDRKECNNRNFNFIGDSGSGKTVLAKLSILRSYHNEEKCFYIIDSTEDGWKFFVDFLGGKIIEIDKINLAPGQSLFAPFEFASLEKYQINQHLEDLLIFLKILKNTEKELSPKEKNFLILSLKELYNTVREPCLSDLYRLWQAQNQEEIHQEWLETIAPYCHVTQGIYASLADGKHSSISGKLILFTFSKLCSDENYIKTSIFLLVNFISKKIIFQKQSKTNLVIDEAWKLFTNNKSAYAKDLITHLARAGRGLDLGLWTISQKPSDLPAEIHSNSSCSFIFQLKENKDRYDIGRFANLREKELESINSGLLNNSGLCFMKTTRSSGFVDIKLNPLEEILCNSTRDFSNIRDQYFREYNQEQNRSAAALATVHKIMQSSKEVFL